MHDLRDARARRKSETSKKKVRTFVYAEDKHLGMKDESCVVEDEE